ncbi:MAG: hypothetical protein IJU01_03985 [Lachnospiraceae bacterium]|nr:hypothetical protein [Lachnospiraceae bacterium]
MKILKKLLILFSALILLAGLSGCGEDSSGGAADYYDNENNEDKYSLENDRLSFELDGKTGYFVLTDKLSGEKWSSIPEGAAEDPTADSSMRKWMQSTILLTCTNADGINTLFDNYSYSIAQGSFAVSKAEDGIRVDYLIGEKVRSYTLPEVISAERFDGYTALMEKSAASTVKSLYKKIDIEKYSDDERDGILIEYPLLEENGVIYVLRSGAAEYKYEQAEDSFSEAGYTYDDYMNDKNSADDSESSMQFNVSFIYSLEKDALRVRVPADSVKYPENSPVTSLQVLPYFVAGTTEDTGYLMIPDGGGAQIDFNARRGSTDTASAKVYGWDAALSKDKMINENKAAFPVFAAAKNGSSLMAVVSGGDAELTVEANVSGVRNSINSVSPSFEIVHGDQVEVSGKSAVRVTVFEPVKPDTDIDIFYFAGQSDSYADMAARYRDYLTERYPNLTAVSGEGLPLAVELVGAVDHVTQVVGIPMSRELVCTDINEAEGIVDGLLSGGANNIFVKYTAAINGGIKQKSLQKINLIGDVADESALKSLSNMLSGNGGLYLGVWAERVNDTGSFDGFSSGSDAVRNTISDIVEAAPYNKVTYKQKTNLPYYILNKEAGSEALSGLREFSSGLKLSGNAFEDLGSEIASDFNKKSHTSRGGMILSQQQELSRMKEDGLGTMINFGNAYAAVYSDFILDMDLTGNGYNISSRQIPFYQIALHGLVYYSGEAVDMTGDYETNLLKSIEYGAGLYAVFAEIEPAELQMTDYTQYSAARSEIWQEKLLSLYGELDKAVGHTYSQRITNHSYVTDTLTLTEYEDGTKVYVNYGYENANADGATVGARDYLVVK